jgi:hypothetical protein
MQEAPVEKGFTNESCNIAVWDILVYGLLQTRLKLGT